MAEMEYSSADMIAQSTFAQLPAARGLDISVEMIVVMPFDTLLEYQGTRKALEAEGLIPAESVWPDGFESLEWTAGAYKFRLRRERPKGVKGPRRSFLEVDWWMLRIDPIKSKSLQERAIERKAKELREATHSASAEGWAESSARFERYYKANRDTAFKAFLARIPGIDGKKRLAA
jgi:hypothetical protein